MPTTDPITSLVSERLDALQRLDTQLAAQEAGVRRKREEIAEELKRLQIAVEVYAAFGANGTAPPTPTFVENDEASNALAGLKIADAAAVVLASRGGTARAGDILRELQSAGRIAPGHNSYSTLFKTLSREPHRFEKKDRGLWRLREEPIEAA